MSVDLVATSLTVHGTVCAGSLLAIWKLGGESKFGTDKISDLHALRPKVLKATVTAVELALNPILTVGTHIEAFEIDENGNPKPKPARLNVDGKEALTNAIRDFVKAQSVALVDLCRLNALDERLTRCLRRLRYLVSSLAIFTIFFCGGLTVAKFEWITLAAGWIHGAAFGLVALLSTGGVLLFCYALNTSSEVDHLKSRYVDL